MAQVTITINSREYAVACEDGQEVRIYQLARQLDEKAKMITQGVGQVNENMLLAMVGLLVADELAELKKAHKAVPEADTPPAVSDAHFSENVTALDNMVAEKLKLLTEQINAVASSINLM